MEQNNTLQPVAVTMGDPAGIGFDVVIEAVTGPQRQDLPPFFLIADPISLTARARLMNRDLTIATFDPGRQEFPRLHGVLQVCAITCPRPVEAGRPDPGNGAAVIASIERAARLVKEAHASAMVTSPIAKNLLHAAGFKHPGHTEFLAELAQRLWSVTAQPVMMLAAPELRVVPVTVHVALSKVPGLLTQAMIETTALITLRALTTDFGIAKPRLAVCGLNPHAGEAGFMGHEDEAIIRPAIDALNAQGHAVTGPHPADTLFHAAARQRYDAVLAMYHDQGLIPIKTLAFDHGVNVTLGLPFVRTSPDHGTAFDIAGTGKASAGSFIAALHMAAEIASRRLGRVV